MAVDLWLGIECTVNRVGGQYFDQLLWSGHADRLQDLDLFASLGVTTMRYPVLWERTAPLGEPDWTWPDRHLYRLRELGIRPIVGLIHHGSGPKFTNLTDPDFATKFSAYARAFAERYPWVEEYTPVNEPLTTARFSGLYGHWYPHGQDDLTFITALLNQSRATVQAIGEIRQVNPGARLIQTEDVGRTFSTTALDYQAEFENLRRWLTFDLLCGRVTPEHRLWSYLKSSTLDDRDLSWLADNACPPDIIGLNHYLTSDRYLDERLDLFPESTHGGNGRHFYADVEAVRVLSDENLGPEARISEVWERYGLPIAITEAHLGCEDENEPVRWLWDVYKAAENQSLMGAVVRAVTAWSALGSYNWHCLVTRDDRCYEAGVFDCRHTRPRPTPVAQLIRAVLAGEIPQSPALEEPGWWKRPERFAYQMEQDKNLDEQVEV